MAGGGRPAVGGREALGGPGPRASGPRVRDRGPPKTRETEYKKDFPPPRVKPVPVHVS